MAAVSGLLAGPVVLVQFAISWWIAGCILLLFSGGIAAWFDGWGHWRRVLRIGTVVTAAFSIFAAWLVLTGRDPGQAVGADAKLFAITFVVSSCSLLAFLWRFGRED